MKNAEIVILLRNFIDRYDLHGNRLTLLGRFNCFILHDD